MRGRAYDTPLQLTAAVTTTDSDWHLSKDRHAIYLRKPSALFGAAFSSVLTTVFGSHGSLSLRTPMREPRRLASERRRDVRRSHDPGQLPRTFRQQPALRRPAAAPLPQSLEHHTVSGIKRRRTSR